MLTTMGEEGANSGDRRFQVALARIRGFSDLDLERIRLGESAASDVAAAGVLIERICELMVRVATTQERPAKLNDLYKRHHRALDAVLLRLGIRHPNQFEDLWKWYWRATDRSLPSYLSRRRFVDELYGPVRIALQAQARGLKEVKGALDVDVPRSNSPAVDRKMARLRQLVRTASTDDEFNAVGLQCLNVLKALGLEVFKPDDHLPEDEEMPKPDDSKRRLSLFLKAVAPGPQGERLRRLVRAAYDQAQEIKHRDHPTHSDMGVAADATAFVVSAVRRVAADPSRAEVRASLHRRDIDGPGQSQSPAA
jgi:hypothetical protein